MNKPRMATSADLDGINQINATLNRPPLSESEINQCGKCVTFVTPDNNKLIAYLSLLSEVSFQSDDDADIHIFVLPDSQHRGTGSDLVDCAFRYANSNTKLKRLTAGVSDDNPMAAAVKHFLLTSA